MAVDAVVLVTSRSPVDELAVALAAREAAWNAAGIESVEAIGDACAPATIAHAVYAGRRYAEELDGPEDFGDSLPFRRELTELAGYLKRSADRSLTIPDGVSIAYSHTAHDMDREDIVKFQVFLTGLEGYIFDTRSLRDA